MRIALFANAHFPRADGTVTFLDGHLPGPVDLLVPTLKELRDRFEAELALFGDGGQEEALTHAAAALGISERVQFAGVVRDPRDLARFYGDDDVIVFVADGRLRGGPAHGASSRAVGARDTGSRQHKRQWRWGKRPTRLA